MASKLPSILLKLNYQKAAEEYLHNLPLTHFMEATAQATQRKITWDSLDLVHSRRPDVQVFNELLVQYPIRGEEQPGKVVPDNMVVLCSEPIKAETSYDLPFQPVGPFWVFEYVSQGSRRKDYDTSFHKYERLKIPYYLLFYPDNQELTLFRYGSRKYVSVKPDARVRTLQQRAEAEAERAEAERQARLAVEQELAQLRTRLAESQERCGNGR
jgi:Uma2 family endonuclease